MNKNLVDCALCSGPRKIRCFGLKGLVANVKFLEAQKSSELVRLSGANVAPQYRRVAISLDKSMCVEIDDRCLVVCWSDRAGVSKLSGQYS